VLILIVGVCSAALQRRFTGTRPASVAAVLSFLFALARAA